MQEKIGANYIGHHKCEFCVWAPLRDEMSVHILSGSDHIVPMVKDDSGYFRSTVSNVSPGTKYLFRFDETTEHPDPASFYQPEDVMGPSSVLDHSSFKWQDKDWQGLSIDEMIIYELHVGTFSLKGTFDGVIEKLPYLEDLGINAIEVMPVAQFPGSRNWGYDGAYPFAVQHSYGGPDGLKGLVNECHQRNISVILDVVYNHLGPEGNFIPQFMPCFTEKHKTPWGSAINFDDAYSYGIRNYFIQNALYWFEHFHIDALRLDAVHGMFDMSAKHFLKELAEETSVFSKSNGRNHYLIAESDLNDRRIIEAGSKGGFGLDAQWSDDFHHCLHTLLTTESQGYYEDFGQVEQLAKALKEGFVYSWDYSKFRKRYHGSSSSDLSPRQFIIFSQNHDQIGNRMKGDRLSSMICFEALKVAAGMVLLAPNVPLLFMGEEFAEDQPFLYFMSFQDEQLVKAVRDGRKKEFAEFNWKGEPDDPYDEKTFVKSMLQWDKIESGKYGVMHKFYKKLIQMRKSIDIKQAQHSIDVSIDNGAGIVSLKYAQKDKEFYIIFNLKEKSCRYESCHIDGKWNRIFVSSDTEWMGPGVSCPALIDNNSDFSIEPFSFIVVEKTI